MRKNRVNLRDVAGKVKKVKPIYMNNGKLLALWWHERRDVYGLSSVHSPEMSDTGKVDRQTQRAIIKPLHHRIQ